MGVGARCMQGADARSLLPGGARREAPGAAPKLQWYSRTACGASAAAATAWGPPSTSPPVLPQRRASHLTPRSRARRHKALRSTCMHRAPAARCVQQAVRAFSAAAQQDRHGGALMPELPHAILARTRCMAGQPARMHAGRQAARRPEPARQALPVHAQRRCTRAPGRA